MVKFHTGQAFISTLLILTLILSAVIVHSSGASADSWTDEFTSYPDLDPRWAAGEIGVILPDGDSYAWPQSFDPRPDNPIPDEELPIWYGPDARTEVSLAADFTVTAVFNCVADVADYNVGKLEVRMLDSSGAIVHSMGWADTSNSTNMASIYAKGQNGALIYTSGEGYSLSIFIDKQLTLQRVGSEIIYLMEGTEIYRGPASQRGVKYVEFGFMRHKAGDIELMCTPNVMKLNSISVQTTAAVVPDAPAPPSANVGSGYVQIEWLEPANTGGIQTSGYRIYRALASGNPELLTSVPSTIHSFNDTGLVNGNQYIYSVSAVNEVGEGAKSVGTSAVPESLPGPPINLQAIAEVDYVDLTWSAPLSDGGSPIINYVIYRALHPNPLSEYSTLGNVLSYTDQAVTAGNTYLYAISAVTGVGEGSLSDVVEAKPGAPSSVPSEPRTLAAVPGDTSAMLSWQAPSSTGNSAVMNYTVYRGFNPETMSAHAVLGNVVSFSDTSLTNGQKYYYKVTATNAVGESAPSEMVNVVPVKPTPPSPPHEPTIWAGDGLIILNWSAPLDDGNSPVSGYLLFRGTNATALTEQAKLGVVASFADTSLINDVTYYYRITALNSVGEGLSTGILTATPMAPPVNNSQIPAEDNPDLSSGGWSLNSSLVTVAVMGVAVVAMIFYLKKPDE